jgi:coronin-1B/1C/6
MNDLSAPLMSDELDQTSGVLFIIYDADSNMIYFVGRGDTTIRFYEVKDDKLVYLSLQTYPEPHKGVAVMPKRGLNINACEIMRFFRVLPNKNIIEPCTWTVPRKSDMFQADLYPETLSNVPSLEADEWLEGKNEEPRLVPIQTLIDNAEAADKPAPKSRAEMIAERAAHRATADADRTFGAKDPGKSSRYEAEKAKAGLTNGKESAAAPTSSVDTARLLDEIKKLTLVVKAHEARIKQLEASVAAAASKSDTANADADDDGVNGS